MRPMLCTLAAVALAVAWGCASQVRGDRRVDLESVGVPGEFVGPPAPVEIDQDSLAGQIAAKVEARLTAIVNARVEASLTAQGFGTYNSQFGVGVVVVMVSMILVLAGALFLTLWLSHKREMQRIQCGIVHPTTGGK